MNGVSVQPSGQSLLTKYRPQTWEQVIGQDAIVASLTDALRKRRSPAYLFSGPPGTGKTTLARLSARELEADDVLEIDAASNTSVDDVRAITETLPYRMSAGARVIILDESHALSKSAVQALLKSLEDPPPDVYWFLCTTEPSKMPVAIKRQRCLTYALKPVPTRELAEWLSGIAEQEGYSDELVDLCAREANGSPRQALSNLAVCAAVDSLEDAAELLHAAEGSVEAFELARALLNGISWSQAQTLLKKLAEKDTDAEGVRRVVCAYMVKVLCGTSKEGVAGRALEVLDVFDSAPFYHSTGLSSVVMAVGRLLLGK